MTCTPEHCRYCFDVLSAKLSGSQQPATVDLPSVDKSFPLFVTWNLKSSSTSATWDSAKLRGCIGNFAPMPLEKGLRDYALISLALSSRCLFFSYAYVEHLKTTVSILLRSLSYHVCNASPSFRALFVLEQADAEQSLAIDRFRDLLISIRLGSRQTRHSHLPAYLFW